MKKTKQFTNLIVTYLVKFLNEKFDKKEDLDVTVNALMGLTFNERSTEESIALIERFKEEVNNELAKRITLAIIEKNVIEWHFKKPIKEDVKNIKTIYEIINN